MKRAKKRKKKPLRLPLGYFWVVCGHGHFYHWRGRPTLARVLGCGSCVLTFDATEPTLYRFR